MLKLNLMPKDVEDIYRKSLADIATDFADICDERGIQGSAVTIAVQNISLAWALCKVIGVTPEEFVYMVKKIAKVP